jgi:dGTPase
MGNPPFGHSGERAISACFKDGEGAKWEKEVREEGGRWEDFLHFEGNANALRLLTNQFIGRRQGGFALTYSTLASIIKYPHSSVSAGSKGKFGFFRSEEETYLKIAGELGISRNTEQPPEFIRYPLVYLVEAADDICYQIMDIEDAYKLHILTFDEIVRLFLDFFEEEKKEHVIYVMHKVGDTNEQIAYLRSSIIGLLVDECSRIFLENEEGMLNGAYSSPLIRQINDLPRKAYAACSEVAHKKIYCAKDVVDIELAGHRIFSRLITILTEAVMNRDQAYSKLLLQRIPEQYDTHAPTTYGKIQCVLDYISGMTDIYALDLYRKITGIGLPAI